MGFVGVILIIVGITHLDDASAGHIRLGYFALGVGVLLCLIELIQYFIKINAMKHGVKFPEDDER